MGFKKVFKIFTDSLNCYVINYSSIRIDLHLNSIKHVDSLTGRASNNIFMDASSGGFSSDWLHE